MLYYMPCINLGSTIFNGPICPLSCNTIPNVPLLLNSWNPFNPILSGVDVVSYFQINAITPQTVYTNYQPLMGDSAFQTIYMGYTYYFSSQINLDLFLENPNNYVPQFGGWCAKGVALEYCLSQQQTNILKNKIPNIGNNYPWTSNCLGPTPSRDCWIIINNKLFMFYRNEARNIFISNLNQNYNLGQFRWNNFIKIWKQNNVNPSIIMSTYSFPTQSLIKKTIY